jgi:hypothetical protein
MGIIAFEIKDGKCTLHIGIHTLSTCNFWHFICHIDLDVHLLQTYIYCNKTNPTSHSEMIVAYFMFVTIRRVLGSMVWFIDTLHPQLLTTINYSTIAISTLHSSILHILESLVFSSRILATDS